VPLVFLSAQSELTVVTGKNRKHQATLVHRGKTLSGSCRN
jgi:hypothetical protein